MLRYPLVVIADFIFWGVFFELADRRVTDILLWAFFGLALSGVFWLFHEAWGTATDKLGGD